MNSSRLEKLLDFLKDDPNDCFSLYAVALEYLNSDKEKAQIYFEKVKNEHPQYLPTYYKLAELYSTTDQPEKAKLTFEEGINLSKNLNELKALNELTAAYNNYLLELDGLL